ncbi:MAG: DUF1634 domain-containing protein [Sphingobacteriales bacterium]|uniref:DUF1634 domain-containing protein n=1 Tax=Hydrotalea flava TaxID=714549 RepID=UPI000833A71A|nr:DUF1634 domain-containing protein [Hydrotalea flava]RTL53239.1 MAG: DUF1634 domain-containing protein [Sphingobacteriales bacterium]
MRKILQDDDLEFAMGNLLRLGVIISSIIVVIGGIIYLYKHGMQIPEYATFTGDKSMFNAVTKIFKGLKEWKGQAIIQLGIMVLIFTPIARIVFSFIGFLIEKDLLYMLLTLIVLAIITFSLLAGTNIV